MPSKLTTHRHYRLLQSRNWSRGQSKLICCQLRGKYKIKWIRLWTRSYCQSKREERYFQSWIVSKQIFDLCIPDLSAAARLKDRIGKEHATCCALVLAVDRKLRSRSKAYLLTHLILTSLVTVAWTQAWVSQPKHVQLSQMMKNTWGLLLPPSISAIRKPSRYEVDSSLPKAIRASHNIVSACGT